MLHRSKKREQQNWLNPKGNWAHLQDKIGREGLRVGDLFNDFENKYRERIRNHETMLSEYYRYDFRQTLEEYEKEWFEGIEVLKSFQITDTEYLVNDSLDNGKSVLAEGAQGTMLDIDFGSIRL